ncbi:MBL fold metallo-hydrolase [Leptospira dzoumogneensis]|uniref:MBL fold metallo-hydrolase n=1 Tax=Leptospira dzoumogneensis TaxID=2484904 RepID=A0A4Z1AS78_9LEPT|nr:MBL fold metallo-hydrolase [Leptospira dzoumogneensis]TGM98479.1 MBL fold metallo-hydrolase [Leptospira dzoumogneensis]
MRSISNLFRNIPIFLAALLAAGLVQGFLGCATAEPKPKIEIPSSKTSIQIQPIFHGSLVLTIGEKTIYVDPSWGGEKYKDLKKPDLILITDIHPDHMDLKTLGEIATKETQIIAPEAVAKEAKEYTNITRLKNGQSASVGDINFSAIPMYNITKEHLDKHTKGRGNGYLIKFGGKTIYISGDTEDIKEMRSLKNIDIAFLCMNQPYTMSVEKAADAVKDFKPKVVYPYHYRGKDGLSDTEKFKALVKESSPSTQVELINWY